ncbi:transcription termination/antitermination protein NusG [Candidatus Uhrbacteria bacterium CG10_big_fil_rev_8_21_14_0_10_50_16]|uniref:Transcription termination/antitermination protein NusG n=1 Tax=Candidatus Uhrbacteria bacterium CG10_big_fil_rev_8_21_14_0_10_50_16 TaxID=1975039 RepID=A0A2H0RMD7_9BACT|nr:MAG: transcription termination/antitermination protein NusG [Candidatus Uhrbacteria bacterium CG10_big_fil_rev_8_21_14_0_10_50_16]
MAKQTGNLGRRWYAIHTYSGYEENVVQNLKQRIDSMDMGDKIFNILIPKEKKIKIKNGKRKVVEEKIFPGYVLIEMFVNDDSWYVVRNTPSVTGFIGSGVTPTPLSEEEITSLQKRMGINEPEFTIDVRVNDLVKIIDGPFKNFEGKVSEIDEQRGKIKVLVNMFGRETPVELDFLQVTPV